MIALATATIVGIVCSTENCGETTAIFMIIVAGTINAVSTEADK